MFASHPCASEGSSFFTRTGTDRRGAVLDAMWLFPEALAKAGLVKPVLLYAVPLAACG